MPTVYRLLDPGRQFIDGDGSPYAGGKLATYTAGTTNNKTTYQDAAGTVAHANPIILDANGRIPAEVWGTTGAYDLVLSTAGDVEVFTAEDIRGINDTATSAVSEWTSSGLDPDYVSATTFRVSGDQTDLLHVGRRIQTTNTGGTVYSTITASAYDAGNTRTDITVSNDSGSLDSGLDSLSYGLVSAKNTSAPGAVHKLGSGSLSAAATLDITGLSTDYVKYIIEINDWLPVTDNVDLWLRLDQNGGASFDAGASDYAWALVQWNESTSVAGQGDGDDSEIVLLGGCGNVATEEISGTIEIHAPANASTLTQITARFARQTNSPGFASTMSGGQFQTAAATDAVRLMFSSGNIAQGNYALYGVR